jgi:UDP-N-acetyl-2-amino-2-deoxyglucuronate dehydrogenase
MQACLDARMPRTFRIGVIGGGGGRGHGWAKRVKNYKNKGDIKLELVAIADINEITLNKTTETFGCKAYTDYVEMLDKEKPDIAIIATPHYVHAPMTIAAAERGIDVLCEKPMCINLQQADAVISAVEKARIKFEVGFQHRFNPLYLGLKNAITSGDLGEIFQINMLFHWWRKEEYYLNSTRVPENKDADWEGWKGHWKTEGAGAIANQIVHFMDVFQWLSPSPIKSVFAESRVAKHTFVETDDNTNTIVEFQNGSMGFIQAGVAYQYGDEEEYGIFGTEGALVRRKNLKGVLGIPKFYEDYRKKDVRKKKRILSYIPLKQLNPNTALFNNFLDAVVNDDASSISVNAHEGRKSIELMRAILLSQSRNAKMEFPFEDDPDEFPALMHTYQDKSLL